MRRTFAGLLLSITIGSVQAAGEIAITGMSKSLGEPRTVELVHPVIRAERVIVERAAYVSVGRGIVNQFCPSTDHDEKIDTGAKLFPDCVIEITGGTTCIVTVDGVSRSFDVSTDGESTWLELEQASRGSDTTMETLLLTRSHSRAS